MSTSERVRRRCGSPRRFFDDHDLQRSLTKVYPAGFPKIAEVTFDVEWGGILDRQHVRNQDMNFAGDFLLTGATI
jgi:hypothetical protein